MRHRFALGFALAAALSSGTAGAAEWPIRASRTAVSFNEPLLDDLGLSIRKVRHGNTRFVPHEVAVRAGPRLVFAAQDVAGNAADIEGLVFEHLIGPGLAHRGGFELRWRDGALSLDRFVLGAAFDPRTFELRTQDGFTAFRADFAHAEADPDSGRIQLFNLDLRISRALARKLGRPEIVGLAVGVLEIDATASAPASAKILGTPPACSDWSGERDVALINLGSAQQWQRGSGLVAISPSATLKNVGTANVPWYRYFTGPYPPHNNDQHPFLIWNIYRQANGRFEQIGTSAAKHAFYSVNTNCDPGACTGASTPAGFGHILGPGCEDVYSQGSNNSLSYLSYRSEITANTGAWNHTGSHFDQNGDGVQDHNGQGEGFMDHGALVAESDLQTAGAQYYIDAWYVVRDDINIFNTMGWRRITPAFNGSMWTFANASGFANGPVVNDWVPESSPPAGSMHTALTQPDGHLRVLVKTTDLGGGQTRYEYAVANHDFDRQIGSFFVPTQGTTVTDLYFHDVDRNPATDWTATQDAQGVTWTKVGAEGLDWGITYNFGFTAPTAPVAANATLGAVAAGGPGHLSAATLAPDIDGVVFRNGFE
jgi:hypothetical protein